MPLIIPSAPASTALVLAHMLSCAAPAPPTFHLTFSPSDPVFLADSKENLGQRSATTNSILRENFPITSGLTESNISMAIGLQLESQQEQGSGEVCIWPKDVQLEITYTANVSIAQDYPQGSCRYNETMYHELRHVKADADTLAEFMPQIEAALAAQAGSLGAAGPVPGSEAETIRGGMMAQVEHMAQGEIDKIESVRTARQQAIDTPQEYTRMSYACPGEPP